MTSWLDIISLSKRGWTPRTGLSRHPLPFNEAVADILKVKPEPKSPRKRKTVTLLKGAPNNTGS